MEYKSEMQRDSPGPLARGFIAAGVVGASTLISMYIDSDSGYKAGVPAGILLAELVDSAVLLCAKYRGKRSREYI